MKLRASLVSRGSRPMGRRYLEPLLILDPPELRLSLAAAKDVSIVYLPVN